MLLFTSTEIICPPGRKGDSPHVIDLAAIRRSEVRQDEVATVTRFKAPELMAEFNKSWRLVNELVVQIKSHKNRAANALDQWRAHLVLDVVADVLKERKIASSADTREAVIISDETYQALNETVNEIEAVVEFLQGKAKSFENAYTSVKKILGEDSFAPGRDPALSGDTNSASRPGFGTPAYRR